MLKSFIQSHWLHGSGASHKGWHEIAEISCHFVPYEVSLTLTLAVCIFIKGMYITQQLDVGVQFSQYITKHVLRMLTDSYCTNYTRNE